MHTQKGPGQAGAQPAPQAGHSAGRAAAAPRCDRAKLWPLFLATLYISTFTFGGGFVIVTFMKRKFVDSLKWLSEEEMLDFAALAQASPGAIAVNAAILVGWRVCGFAGMAVAVLGTILPPMVILSVISLFYAAFAANRWVALALKGHAGGRGRRDTGRGLRPWRQGGERAQRPFAGADGRGLSGKLCV